MKSPRHCPFNSIVHYLQYTVFSTTFVTNMHPPYHNPIVNLEFIIRNTVIPSSILKEDTRRLKELVSNHLTRCTLIVRSPWWVKKLAAVTILLNNSLVPNMHFLPFINMIRYILIPAGSLNFPEVCWALLHKGPRISGFSESISTN